MKLEKNQTIKFKYPSVLMGIPMVLIGIIKGFGDAVRKMWPEEMGEVPDDYLLVWRKDKFENEQHFAVAPEEVIDLVIIKEDQ